MMSNKILPCRTTVLSTALKLVLNIHVYSYRTDIQHRLKIEFANRYYNTGVTYSYGTNVRNKILPARSPEL